MHLNQELAQYFLQVIHHYYPIGLPHLSGSYPGFQELQQIQRKKFDAIEHGEPKAWYDLVEGIRNLWTGHQVFNSVAAQFPCYEASVTLNDTSMTGRHVHSSLMISISLLTRHYAIIVLDYYSYMGPEDSGVAHTFVCSGTQHHLALDARINELKNLVSKSFPDHAYADHDVLFKYKIHGGYPCNGSYSDPRGYTIYDYLFSGGLIGRQYTVAH